MFSLDEFSASVAAGADGYLAEIIKKAIDKAATFETNSFLEDAAHLVGKCFYSRTKEVDYICKCGYCDVGRKYVFYKRLINKDPRFNIKRAEYTRSEINVYLQYYKTQKNSIHYKLVYDEIYNMTVWHDSGYWPFDCRCSACLSK